jgi:hypothetical protein
MSNKLLSVLCLVPLMVAPTCRADMTVKMYLAGSRTVNGVYLSGVGQGFSSANFWLKQRGLPTMYCEPDSLPLDGNDYLKIVDRQIEQLRRGTTKPEFNEMLIPLLLQKALMESFPCHTAK